MEPENNMMVKLKNQVELGNYTKPSQRIQVSMTAARLLELQKLAEEAGTDVENAILFAVDTFLGLN